MRKKTAILVPILLLALGGGCAAVAQEYPPEKVNMLIQDLKGEDSKACWNAILALRSTGEKRAIEPLVQIVGQTHSDTLVREVAVTLSAIDSKKAVMLLIDMFTNDEKVKARCNAAMALAEIGDKRAIAPLIKGLEDRDNEVRRIAAIALGNMRAKEAVARLIEVLKDNDANVRMFAAHSLGDIGDIRAIEPLTESWQEDKESWVSLNAAYGLAKICPNHDAFEFLVKSLKDNNEDIRLLAPLLLGKIGDKRAVEPILKELEEVPDSDDAARAFYAKSLKDLTNQDFGEDYDKWKAWYEKNKDK